MNISKNEILEYLKTCNSYTVTQILKRDSDIYYKTILNNRRETNFKQLDEIKGIEIETLEYLKRWNLRLDYLQSEIIKLYSKACEYELSKDGHNKRDIENLLNHYEYKIGDFFTKLEYAAGFIQTCISKDDFKTAIIAKNHFIKNIDSVTRFFKIQFQIDLLQSPFANHFKKLKTEYKEAYDIREAEFLKIENPKSINDRNIQEFKDLFIDDSKYNKVVTALAKSNYINPDTIVWIDTGKGYRSLASSMIKFLHSKGYFEIEPTNEDILTVCKNTFRLSIGIDTVKQSKASKYDFSKLSV